MMQPVFRLAPSPNGQLHLGHAYSALLNEKKAQESHGRLLLRIEDTDQSRCHAGLTEGVFADLKWLGIRWEEPVRIQSQHSSDYDAALEILWRDGHAFPCFCSRKQAAERALNSFDPEGHALYGGHCRSLSQQEADHRMGSGEIFGWRLKTAGTAAAMWGDVVIAKPGVGSSYHIAVVVDDALQGVTHVVRGKDIEAATSIHKLLQQHLSLPTPHYHHHDLILDEGGKKLSKSRNSPALASLRSQGVTPQQIRAQLGF
jgi:glutamyl-Q tRNA(Asp) synthetase